MTYTSPALSLTQIGVREQVCAECDCRTPGDGACGRETGCSVFLLLPRICDLVGRHQAEPPCGFGLAVRNLLRHAADSQAILSQDDTAPLDRHAEATVAVVQQVFADLRAAG
jgi:hypothetical protein